MPACLVLHWYCMPACLQLSGASAWSAPDEWWAPGDVDERFQAWVPVMVGCSKDCIGCVRPPILLPVPSALACAHAGNHTT
jgi:hypothetical protein